MTKVLEDKLTMVMDKLISSNQSTSLKVILLVNGALIESWWIYLEKPKSLVSFSRWTLRKHMIHPVGVLWITFLLGFNLMMNVGLGCMHVFL